MTGSIEDYLTRLEKQLRGCDPAVIQDALADAEDHLRTDLAHIMRESPAVTAADALAQAVRKYGDPAETAAAYRQLEVRFPSGLASDRNLFPKPGFHRFFAIYADPRAWGGFFYMLLAGFTGAIYGLWTLTGGAAALFAMLLVIGIPVSALYLLSVRGLVLMDGRLVEALLGVRMPRRPLFLDPGKDRLERLRALFTDTRTWKALIYLVFHFPLGLIYLFLSAGIFVLALCFMGSPVLELGFHLPLELLGTGRFTPVWLLPIVSLAGFVLLTSCLHLAAWIGRLHARYARAMLITRRGEDAHV